MAVHHQNQNRKGISIGTSTTSIDVIANVVSVYRCLGQHSVLSHSVCEP